MLYDIPMELAYSETKAWADTCQKGNFSEYHAHIISFRDDQKFEFESSKDKVTFTSQIQEQSAQTSLKGNLDKL